MPCVDKYCFLSTHLDFNNLYNHDREIREITLGINRRGKEPKRKFKIFLNSYFSKACNYFDIRYYNEYYYMFLMYVGINNIISNLFLNREVVIDASKSNITEGYKLFFYIKKTIFMFVFFRYSDKKLWGVTFVVLSLRRLVAVRVLLKKGESRNGRPRTLHYHHTSRLTIDGVFSPFCLFDVRP